MGAPLALTTRNLPIVGQIRNADAIGPRLSVTPISARGQFGTLVPHLLPPSTYGSFLHIVADVVGSIGKTPFLLRGDHD